MATANEILDQQFLEMRWRVLSLAADLDRIQRAAEEGSLPGDGRLDKLREAIGILTSGEIDRAERVQMLFSDRT
jgi:hypothetical protein